MPNERPTLPTKGTTMTAFALAILCILAVGVITNVIGHFANK